MDSREEFLLTEEAAEWIGLKKSQYLSRLIGIMGPQDFGFETFHQFDHLIPTTIENPDRVYLDEKEDYPLSTYIRTFSEPELLHQLVIGAIFPDTKNKAEVFVPILSFVTREDGVVQDMIQGSLKERPTLN